MWLRNRIRESGVRWDDAFSVLEPDRDYGMHNVFLFPIKEWSESAEMVATIIQTSSHRKTIEEHRFLIKEQRKEAL